jgi:hypothetical protein
MSRCIKALLALTVSATVLSCGGDRDVTPSASTSDEVATKEPTKASGPAEVLLVAAEKPVSLFSYRKEKVTADEAKSLKHFDNKKIDGVDYQKIDVNAKEIFNFLKKGGVLKVELRDLEPREFIFHPKEVRESGYIGGYSKLQEEGGSSDVAIGTDGIVVLVTIRIRAEEFDISSTKTGDGHFLVQIDPSKRRPHHGTEYKRLYGDPPIQAPKPPETNDKKPLIELIPPANQTPSKKTVTSSPNMRIGVMLTQSASTEMASKNVSTEINFGLDWLRDAMTASSINVTFTLAGTPEAVGVVDTGKSMEAILTELNAPSPVRADVASFRLKNDVDVLIVVVGDKGPSGDAIGYALMGGNALQSTIVVDTSDLRGYVIAHEIGHLMGADHHILDRVINTNVTPFYGHITPQDPEFLQAERNADIMAVIHFPLWKCSGPGAISSCKNDRIFSDPTKEARRSPMIFNGTVSAAGCALQSPVGASPCAPGSCLTYNACPYSLAFGWCASTFAVFKPTAQISSQNMSCYPATRVVNPFQVTQFYGVASVSDVASLWKSPRAAEVANFRNVTQPFLRSAIAQALRPVFSLLL